VEAESQRKDMEEFGNGGVLGGGGVGGVIVYTAGGDFEPGI
jgi:hypothetical protein